MAETVELPSRLAILPFRNKVLLPGAIIRIRCTSHSSVTLVEQELWQKEEKGLIGILPVRDDAEGSSIGTMINPGAGSDSGERSLKFLVGTTDAQKSDAKDQHEAQWHTRGVAARALHLSRGVEKPSGRVTYVVVLEGLSRFNVQELGKRGPYSVARITSLEMTKAELDQVQQDSDFVALSRQFKTTAMELVSVLEQKQKTGGRTKVLLDTVPIQKLADIFVASFEMSFEEQLSMLDSVDLKVRLSKATELVDRHLQSIRVAEKITQKVEGQLSKSQKEYLLRQQMRAIKEELGDNDDDEDDVAALERKMQAAGMPSNIWKHAQRELRRLKKMQPQQPGYNSSRVYLELLADLPWEKASEEHELDLKAAKERLDSDHYGLAKVKQRIIEYLAVRKLKPDARGPVLCFVGPPGVGKTSLASSIAAALGRKFVRLSLGGVKDEADIRGHRRTYIGSMPGRLIDGLKVSGLFLEQHGLSSEFLKIPEAMVKNIIQRYTREAGVRSLERNLAAVARAAAVMVAEHEQTLPLSKDVQKLTSPLLNGRMAEGGEVEMEVIPMGVNDHEIEGTFQSPSAMVVDETMLEKILGVNLFLLCSLIKYLYHGIVRARASDFKLALAGDMNVLDGRDIHIHFPAGAVPKDGPSAGVTLVTALVSLFSQKRVRADTAMTGEMTLRGLVLPVGGIKDKILAAHRYGIKRVILPQRNSKDLVEVPAAVLSSLEVILAKRMEDVLENAFEGGCPWRNNHSKL
ncbi:PREDICTED: lon protease homolog 2, peroxisomal-like [Camelina sativa]|uniref:Lon protease homolog n=1 Tax=Camelina sativa TaxID=90675 RepID=A0ABM1RET9_CAMSA|nr:PREDICTED: lon protease homolog 2, peroxisomal-like [Camelina sativa]